MNKFGFLLLAALAPTGALASEVGATFPQLANSTALIAVAIAETGASASLAFEPDSDVINATQHSHLYSYTEQAYEALSTELEARILEEVLEEVASVQSSVATR